MGGRIVSPELIGRESELAAIADALKEARSGEGRTLLIGGEAGVGKTRLLTAALADARSRGAVVLQGGCVGLAEGSLPFAPVVEAIRPLIGRDQDDADEAALGVAAELGLVARRRAEAAAELRPDWARTQLYERFLALLTGLAAGSPGAPVVLAIEDLHWGSDSTRELLAFLIRNSRSEKLLLLITFRSDELHRRHPLLLWLGETNRYPGVARVELARLTRPAIERQLAGILGHEPAPGLVGSIFARSEGNPFFAEELMAAGAETGPLPPTLREVLAARLAHVSEPTFKLLGVAAVVGRRVDHDLLAKVADLSEAELDEALTEALSAQLLVADAQNPRDGYAFRHALLAEAAAETVLPGRRRRLHECIAQALSDSDGLRGAEEAAHLIEVAHHWFEARELDQAFAASLAAGDAALAADAYPEALHQYERALELWDIAPTAVAQAGLDRVDLLRRTAHAAQLSGEYARAAQVLREAIELIAGRGDKVVEGLLYERLGRSLWTAVDFAASTQAYRRAMELVPDEPPSEDRARVLAGCAQVLMLGSRYGESLEISRRALALARETGSRQLEGHAMNTLGVDMAMLGDVDAGLALTEESLAIAEEVHDLDDLGRGYANYCSVLDVAGRPKDATEVALRGMARMRELGMTTTYAAFNAMNAADGLISQGRWDEALALIMEVQPTARGTSRFYATVQLAHLLVVRGDLSGASVALDEISETYREGADAQFNGPIAVARLELATMTGDTATGRQVADKAVELVARSDDAFSYAHVLLAALQLETAAAELARASRDAAGERAAVERGSAYLEAMRGLGRGLAPARAARLQQAIAIAEAEATRFASPDPTLWRHALATAADDGPAYEAAYATYRLAESLLSRRSDRAEAAELLARASELAAHLGARPLHEAVTALATRARIALPAARDVAEPGPEAASGPVLGQTRPHSGLASYGLSDREIEVLRLVAAGRTNRQIGKALFISESTAGVHVSHILTKLNVAGRVEAATIAARLGLT